MVRLLGVGEKPEPLNGPGVTDENDDDDQTPAYYLANPARKQEQEIKE